MRAQSESVKLAEDALIREAALVISGTQGVGSDLERAVHLLTRRLRAAGHPPEKALATVKYAAFKAGAGAVIREDAERERRTTGEVVTKMVRWFVEAYYAPTVESARPATEEPQLIRSELRLLAELSPEFNDPDMRSSVPPRNQTVLGRMLEFRRQQERGK